MGYRRMGGHGLEKNPADKTSGAGQAVDVPMSRMSLKTAVNLPHAPAASLLGIETSRFDLTLKEIECARAFNFDLPEDLGLAVRMIENAIAEVTGAEKNIVLLLNEETGTYTCINDDQYPEKRAREMTRVSDGFLQDLLDSDDVVYTHLVSKEGLLGMVAIAERVDGEPLGVRDEITLEFVSRYLATKALGYQTLKQFLSHTYVQSSVAELSARLVTAVDEESILQTMLDMFSTQLGFSICQYVAYDEASAQGHIILQASENGMESFVHEGLKSKRKVIRDYTSLVGLLASGVRKEPYLHIPGRNLGDKSLNEVFCLHKRKHVESALVLPVVDTSNGAITGTFHLIRTSEEPITSESIDIAKESAMLTSLALGRAKVLEKALALASSDELTGLTNRRGFYDRFESEIERARRNPTSLCVVMIDVDHFKQLNDTYGHLNGDRVLQSIAAQLLKNVRRSDVVCRFGGEEFAILLPDTTLKSAGELMERIRERIEKSVVPGLQGEKIRVTVSAGLAKVNLATGLARPVREVISESMVIADEELYAAKESGRNKVCISCTKKTVQA